MDALHYLVDEQPFHDDQLILLYSVGRCGSTLMSEVFNQLDDVVSLSEPDVFTQLLKMRRADGKHDVWLKRLLKTSLLSLMKPMPLKRPLKYVIKFRSFGIELIDLISEMFPHAQNLFMYRNAEDWARSSARAFQKLESEKGSVGSDHERRWVQRSEKVAEMSRSIFGKSAPAPVRKIINRMDGKRVYLANALLICAPYCFPQYGRLRRSYRLASCRVLNI